MKTLNHPTPESSLTSTTSLLLQSFPLVKLIGIVVTILYLGIIKGILLCFIVIKSYNLLMLKGYDLEPFAAGDKTFVFRPESEHYNLGGYIVIDEDYDIEKIKTSIINRAVKLFRKLRSIKVYKNFEFWWKELPLASVLNDSTPFETRINRSKFYDIDDMLNYCYDEGGKTFDMYNEIGYKFIFIKNTEGVYRNMILFKADHLLADGLGLVGLLSAIGENYDIKLFPQSMKKNSMNIAQIVGSFLSVPYYALYVFYNNLIYLNTGGTPFKSRQPVSGFPKISISQAYNFAHYSKINKSMNITFNDMMMNLFSVSIKRYLERHCLSLPKRLSTITPISNRSGPKDVKNLIISNDTSAVACEGKLISDPIKEYDIVSKEFKNNVRNIGMYKVIKVMSDFINNYCPYYVGKFLYGTATKGFDITFSNVALPKEALIYGGYKVKEFLPLMTTGLTYAFIGICSYNGAFRVTISLDNAGDICPKELMGIFDEEIGKMGEYKV